MALLTEDQLAARLTPELLRSITAGFYRQVPADDLLGPMYPADDMEAAEKRLGDFLLHRFLGDPTYMRERGHPRLRMRHMPFSIGIPERDRWMRLMTAAMAETPGLDADTLETLTAFFGQVADTMRNRMERGI
jgi:hemoglobin